MPEYKDIPDSGKRRDFGTGSVRDVAAGKPRMDLISVFLLKRLGTHYGNGCDKYGMRNWELGQPSSQYMASAQRHIIEYMMGDRSEDHLAAVAWNIGGIIHNEELIERGLYDKSLHDLPDYSTPEAFERTIKEPALFENKKLAAKADPPQLGGPSAAHYKKGLDAIAEEIAEATKEAPVSVKGVKMWSFSDENCPARSDCKNTGDDDCNACPGGRDGI